MAIRNAEVPDPARLTEQQRADLVRLERERGLVNETLSTANTMRAIALTRIAELDAEIDRIR